MPLFSWLGGHQRATSLLELKKAVVPRETKEDFSRRVIMSAGVKANLTKKMIEGFPSAAPGKRAYYWDTQVRSLVVDVTSTGCKNFYVRRKLDKRRHIVLIGPFPEITIEQARRKALEICGQIALGSDPNQPKRALAAQPTLGDLLDTYIEQHGQTRCLAWKEMQAVFRRYLSTWRKRKLSSISKAEVAERINEIGRVHGHVPANHTITYARAAINWCINNGIFTGDNPWSGIAKFKIASRERFLRPNEVGRFMTALKDTDNTHGFRDYIYLSLFTGARRANVFAMRWDQIDFKLGTWTIPKTKSGDYHIVPLTQPALEVLQARRETVNSEWVFPSESRSGHLEEPKRAWKRLLKVAEIEDLRLHDLRRTLGSYMAMGNQSLHMIGKVLGHKSPTATQIYSRFAHDPVRAAMERAHTDMLHLADLKVTAPNHD